MIFPGCSSFASGDARVHHANWLQKNRPFNISSKPFMWNIYLYIDAHLHSISWSGCRVLQTFDASLLRFCLCFAKATWQWPWCDCTWRHVQDLGRALCPGRISRQELIVLCLAASFDGKEDEFRCVEHLFLERREVRPRVQQINHFFSIAALCSPWLDKFVQFRKKSLHVKTRNRLCHPSFNPHLNQLHVFVVDCSVDELVLLKAIPIAATVSLKTSVCVCGRKPVDMQNDIELSRIKLEELKKKHLHTLTQQCLQKQGAVWLHAR